MSRSTSDDNITSEHKANGAENPHELTMDGPNDKDNDSSGVPFTESRNHHQAMSDPEEPKATSDETTIDGSPVSLDEQPFFPNPDLFVANATLEKRDDCNNWSDAKCYKEIQKEIDTLLKTVYIRQAVPLQQSVRHLRELNDKLTGYKRSAGELEEDLSKMFRFEEATDFSITQYNMCTKLHEAYLGKVTQKEYTKTKLYMELYRLEMIMGDTVKVPSYLALTLVQNLNGNLACKADHLKDFDIEDILKRNENYIKFPHNDTPQDSLEEEMNRLRNTLLDSNKMTMEVALDIIVQFNVQLESFLEYHKNL